MTDHSQQDVTVMRADLSLSGGAAIGSDGPEVDAPRVLKQRFVLEEKLGSGGMGTVFRAKDLRKVEARDRQPFLAVKVLNSDFRTHPEAFIALQREAAKSQTLSHKNIVSIFDFDKDGDVPFMTMELLEGQELADLLRAYPQGLPDPLAWDVIKGICAGLEHAHDAGIVHADFKPGNVFVSPKNDPKVLDFGIARAVHLTEGEGEDTLFDPARLAALTPAYASREMLNGDNPEVRDDLYSLGVVIYLILTGHHPYGRMPADAAATEGLRAEKPKRLSRRQWQAVSRCLAFNRQDRPANVAELEKYLFHPSPWRSRSAIAAAAAFSLALGINYLVDDAELTEVKQEVRESTLLDAQTARLAALLDKPVMDDNWEQLVSNELQTLEGLTDADSQAAAIRDRITSLYSRHVLASADLAEAQELLARGLQFGELAEAGATVEQKAIEQIYEMLDNTRPDALWQEELNAELQRLTRTFPAARSLAWLNLEFAEVIEESVRDSAAEGRLDDAEALLAELQPREFDAVVLEELSALIERSRRELAADQLARSQREQLRQDRAQFASRFDELLNESCLRLDLPKLHAIYRERYADPLPKSSTANLVAREQIAHRLEQCLPQLAELDPDRAQALQKQAENLFGMELLSGAGIDPCALTYLIGNGAQAGRRGYCADRLSDGSQGPRLVVVPTEDGSGRYAMTKQEISWLQFRQFCQETSSCDVATPVEGSGAGNDEIDEKMPVTGVSISIVQNYADWLSEITGFTYRLPTSSEWQWAAQGEPDPNRNCRVRLDSVQRGLAPQPTGVGQSNSFGLVHMLGNVQEWVLDDDSISAVGGAYTDPIQDCSAQMARSHAGEASTNTGFRLVREVS